MTILRSAITLHRSWYFICLLATFFLATLMRWIAPTGLISAQSLERAKEAHALIVIYGESENLFTAISQHIAQVGWLSTIANFPLSLSYFAFGVNDHSSTTLSLFSSLVTICLLFAIATKITGSAKAGIIASFFWAILPLDAFYSSSLLLVSPLLALSNGGLYCFIFAKEKRSLAWATAAVILFLPAYYLDPWLTTGPAIFIAASFIPLIPERLRKTLWLFLVLAIALFTATGLVNLSILSSLLVIKESYLFLPLFALALVWRTNQREKSEGEHISRLFSIVLLMLLSATWFQLDPMFVHFGGSKFWLVLMIPMTILIAQYLSSGISTKSTLMGIFICAVALSVLILAKVIWTHSEIASNLEALSRISNGLAFIAIWLTAFRQGNLNQGNAFLIFGMIFSFGFGSLSTLASYRQSYQSNYIGLDQAYKTIDQNLDRSFLVVESQEVANRIEYTKGFNWSHTDLFGVRQNPIIIMKNDPERIKNSYVLLSLDYVKFTLVHIPNQWIQKGQFGKAQYPNYVIYNVP